MLEIARKEDLLSLYRNSGGDIFSEASNNYPPERGELGWGVGAEDNTALVFKIYGDIAAERRARNSCTNRILFYHLLPVLTATSQG